MQIWAKMKLTRMYKTNDFKISYPKSALSSSLTAGCGLKKRHFFSIRKVTRLSSSSNAG
jgi:hypothetical protein